MNISHSSGCGICSESRCNSSFSLKRFNKRERLLTNINKISIYVGLLDTRSIFINILISAVILYTWIVMKINFALITLYLFSWGSGGQWGQCSGWVSAQLWWLVGGGGLKGWIIRYECKEMKCFITVHSLVVYYLIKIKFVLFNSIILQKKLINRYIIKLL